MKLTKKTIPRVVVSRGEAQPTTSGSSGSVRGEHHDIRQQEVVLEDTNALILWRLCDRYQGQCTQAPPPHAKPCVYSVR